MGTEITLDVGGLTLVYNKNMIGWDHGSLFQEKDRQRRRSSQIDYDYFKEHQDDPGAREMAFMRPLREVVPRLEMLGFTPNRIESEYEQCAKNWSEETIAMADDESPAAPDVMNYDEFRAFATEHAIESLDNTFVSSMALEADVQRHGRFHEVKRLPRIPHSWSSDSNAWSERSYFGGLIEILHPYSLLRLLALNEKNLDAPVVWQYGPLVEAGWATADEFVAGARRTETFLVATEGSSDVHVLNHALSLLRPEVADFFRFIDVNESHPFSGAGNLLKFAEGLIKIDSHNQVVVVFDNDAEGCYAHQRLSKMRLPINMRAMTQPELDEFRSFAARGPEGVTATDINRRAAAIECYLDLMFEGSSPPKVLWTNYKSELDVYQGALEHKESFLKKFMRQTAETLMTGGYDTRKLRAVLDALVAECSSMRVEIETAKPFKVAKW